MQLMPATAQTMVAQGLVDSARWDPADLSDPEVNIEYGCACLGYLQRQLSSLDEVVAAYNAGIGTVRGWIVEGGSIPEDVEFEETRIYLERVNDAYEATGRAIPTASRAHERAADVEKGVVVDEVAEAPRERAGNGEDSGVGGGDEGVARLLAHRGHPRPWAGRPGRGRP